MASTPPSQEQPILNIIGEKVALGPANRAQLPVYQRWFNDFATMRTQGEPGLGPRTLEEMTPWYDNHMARAPDVHWFSVYEVGSWRLIGFAELRDLHYRNGTAELTMMIGEPDCRGKGCGTETARLMLDYGFTALGLNNVMLTVAEFNLAGRRAYEKAGFREIGRRRQAWLMGGQRWDEIYMDCLAAEFTSPLLGRILMPDPPR